MLEYERREGETVELFMIGRDDKGLVMSELSWKLFGMDNPQANKVQIDIVKALADLTIPWTKEKNA